MEEKGKVERDFAVHEKNISVYPIIDMAVKSLAENFKGAYSPYLKYYEEYANNLMCSLIEHHGENADFLAQATMEELSKKIMYFRLPMFLMAEICKVFYISDVVEVEDAVEIAKEWCKENEVIFSSQNGTQECTIYAKDVHIFYDQIILWRKLEEDYVLLGADPAVEEDENKYLYYLYFGNLRKPRESCEEPSCSADGATRTCVKCKDAVYCSKKCTIKDRENHRRFCVEDIGFLHNKVLDFFWLATPLFVIFIGKNKELILFKPDGKYDYTPYSITSYDEKNQVIMRAKLNNRKV